jgi:hypothetical protein
MRGENQGQIQSGTEPLDMLMKKIGKVSRLDEKKL